MQRVELEQVVSWVLSEDVNTRRRYVRLIEEDRGCGDPRKVVVGENISEVEGLQKHNIFIRK